jgi:hypothetical protein
MKKDIDSPAILLSEEKMVDIMFDVQILESDLNYKKSMGENKMTLKDSYYDQLFKHYHVNDEVFDQNIRYYTQRPEVLEKIMDQVLKRLLDQQNLYSSKNVSKGGEENIVSEAE